MLAAGFYVQANSTDDAFATADANRRLTEQGIKLGNPSQCVKQSLLAKRVFLVSKGRYRVSQPGRAHLRQLLGRGDFGATRMNCHAARHLCTAVESAGSVGPLRAIRDP